MKNAWKIFLNRLLKSFIIIALLMSTAVLSYHTARQFIHIPDKVEEVSLEPAIKKEIITTASIDDISKNLIFCVEENGSISKLVLEVFHCADRKLIYYTIPIRTRLTMSDTLYQELIVVNPSVPQIMKLSGITKYFPESTAYEYGVLLVEELLKIKVSYYTVLPESIHKTIFKTEDIALVGELPRELFSEEFSGFVHTLQKEEDLKNYIEELYEDITSNLTLLDKMNYVESYLKLQQKNVTFELIAGDNTNSAYIINMDKAIEQMN